MNNRTNPCTPGTATQGDAQLVERFSSLMASRDWPVDPPRMLGDSAYAYKRLAIAYGSGDAALKALSLKLYARYQSQSATRTHRRQPAGN
jgi:hypothetical protein